MRYRGSKHRGGGGRRAQIRVNINTINSEFAISKHVYLFDNEAKNWFGTVFYVDVLRSQSVTVKILNSIEQVAVQIFEMRECKNLRTAVLVEGNDYLRTVYILIIYLSLLISFLSVFFLRSKEFENRFV